MFAVDCEECGEQLREPELLGMRIRRPARLALELELLSGLIAEKRITVTVSSPVTSRL